MAISLAPQPALPPVGSCRHHPPRLPDFTSALPATAFVSGRRVLHFLFNSDNECTPPVVLAACASGSCLDLGTAASVAH